MGRTVATCRMQLQKEQQRWNSFRKALRVENQEVFDRLFVYARTFADAGSVAACPCTSEALFMSMLIGLEKEIQEFRQALEKVIK